MSPYLDVAPARCERCDAATDEMSVEAWELTHEVLCEDCADTAMALAADAWADEQPGRGAL